MNNPHNQNETYIDNNGQVHRRGPGSTVRSNSRPYRPGPGDYRITRGGGGIELDESSRRILTIAVVAMLLMGLASFGSGYKSAHNERDHEQETPVERNLAADDQSLDEQRRKDGVLAGTKGVISGELVRYPGSPYPYKINYAGRNIPIELDNGHQYLGKWINLWVEYTGDGEKFDIKKVNVVE